MDGYIAMASHRLNPIVKVLTIVAMVFGPLSFVARFYGMNCESMPELRMRSPPSKRMTACLASGVLLVLSHKGWLGRE